MKKSQNKIAVDVVLLPPDEVIDKAIEVNQALIKTFDNKIILNKQNCFPHISLAMGCIKKEDIPEIDTVLKDISEELSPITLTISDIHAGTIPTGEKVLGFEIEKTKDIQLLHETVMKKLSPYFTYDVSLDMIYALPNQQVEEVTTHWIKNYQKESSFDKFYPHITIGIGEVEGETRGLRFPTQFSVSKLALGHLGNYCTCKRIVLLHDLIKNKDANHGCTIIIPTYNRPDYLKRILNYYNEEGEKYKIVVADSSLDENKKLNEEIISSFLNLNILHLSDYPTTIDGLHKIDDALNYVNTKYCVFCADDDFVTPNGINQSVDFLEKNPDFAIAHGHYISFYLKKVRAGKQKFCWNSCYPSKSNTFPDAVTRLTEHLSNYSIPTFYAVHRTDFLKMIWEETTKFTNDYRFGELLPSMLILIYGKLKCLDVLYVAREFISTSSGQNCETINDFIKAGTYDEKYAKFSGCLATHLSKKSQLSKKESKKVVDKAMANYMNGSLSKFKLEIKVKQALKAMKISDDMIGRIGEIYSRISTLKERNKTENITNGFQIPIDTPSSKYYNDFNNIRNHVLNTVFTNE